MKKRLDTILLAAALFTVSGAMLAYNLAMLGRDRTVSAVSGTPAENDSVISSAAAKQLDASIEAGALPTDADLVTDSASDSASDAEADAASAVGLVRGYELLPPVVTAPD